MDNQLQERRRFVRTPVSVIGSLTADGRTESCSVLDFSQGGAKVLASEQFAEQQPITLKIDGFGEFLCELVWQNDQHYGLCFRDPEQLSSDSAGANPMTHNIVGLDPF